MMRAQPILAPMVRRPEYYYLGEAEEEPARTTTTPAAARTARNTGALVPRPCAATYYCCGCGGDARDGCWVVVTDKDMHYSCYQQFSRIDN